MTGPLQTLWDYVGEPVKHYPGAMWGFPSHNHAARLALQQVEALVDAALEMDSRGLSRGLHEALAPFQGSAS